MKMVPCFTGTCTSFDETGEAYNLITYYDGLHHGKQYYYDAQGYVVDEYVDGELHGEGLNYWQGRLHQRFVYDHGKYVLVELYGEDGNLISRSYYDEDNNKIREDWYAGRRIFSTDYFNAGSDRPYRWCVGAFMERGPGASKNIAVNAIALDCFPLKRGKASGGDLGGGARSGRVGVSCCFL